MTKWTSRKLTVCLAAFATATALLVLGHIDMATWKWAAGITVGAYLASQGLADAIGSK